jgi:hypothetical protein
MRGVSKLSTSTSTSLLLDAEKKLAADPDGAYRAQLIGLLEKFRDEFALAKQGLLPPDEYQVADNMEAAVTAALAVVRFYESDGDPSSSGLPANSGVANIPINV